jgi:hypothetical protein
MADLDLQDLFSYHAPDGDDRTRYEALRSAARNFAEAMIANCPPSADRSAAVRKVREALMTANASIALKGRY